MDVVAQALRDVKEYAARSSEVNVDTMQLKLMHLDEVARRVNHSHKELFSLVLQHFLCHKNHENIGFLVTSLLSSTAETKLFEKEQNFMERRNKRNQIRTRPPNKNLMWKMEVTFNNLLV